MKPFRGPRYQLGWIGIVVAAIGAYASSRSQQNAQKQQNAVKYEDARDLSNLQFEQQRWLDEQSRAWAQQDKQFDLNYKENAIGGFRDAAPANVLTADGSYGTPPAPTHLDTSGLAPTQANGQAAIYDPRTGQPMLGNVPPMNQFAGGPR
jgi:hypothetical protein